jgi:hypothetical protein
MPALNVQSQEKIEWPRKLVVAKAYVDQLERSQALPTDRITALRQAIQNAEGSKLSRTDLAKLKGVAQGLDKSASQSKNSTDSARLQAVADILNAPSL